jgi:hypothetical protein
LFLRGDNAFSLLISIRELQEHVSRTNDTVVASALRRIEGIADIIEQDVVVRQGQSEPEAAPPDAEANASTERCWEVWRQGDDGNPFLVKDELSMEEPDGLVTLYESRGNKQVYWKTNSNPK